MVSDIRGKLKVSEISFNVSSVKILIIFNTYSYFLFKLLTASAHALKKCNSRETKKSLNPCMNIVGYML